MINASTLDSSCAARLVFIGTGVSPYSFSSCAGERLCANFLCVIVVAALMLVMWQLKDKPRTMRQDSRSDQRVVLFFVLCEVVLFASRFICVRSVFVGIIGHILIHSTLGNSG